MLLEVCLWIQVQVRACTCLLMRACALCSLFHPQANGWMSHKPESVAVTGSITNRLNTEI